MGRWPLWILRAVVPAVALSGCGGGGGGGDVPIPPYWSYGGVAVSDLDGDGRADVALAATYLSGPPPHPGYVLVYLQQAGGGFAAASQYPVGPDPWALAVGDLDGDVRPGPSPRRRRRSRPRSVRSRIAAASRSCCTTPPGRGRFTRPAGSRLGAPPRRRPSAGSQATPARTSW